jgi:hypothetical protein
MMRPYTQEEFEGVSYNTEPRNYVAWDRSKSFAWDQSSALKRELWSTAKALTPIDSFAWDGSKR